MAETVYEAIGAIREALVALLEGQQRHEAILLEQAQDLAAIRRGVELAVETSLTEE